MEKFVCSHCGYRFESEPAESLICPNCFWSTSVNRIEESKLQSKPVATTPENVSQKTSHFLLWIGAGIFVFFLVATFLFAARHLKKQDEFLQKIETENSQVIAKEAPELATPPVPAAKEDTDQKVSLPVDRPLTDLEKEVLTRRIPLKSRLARGIQTPPWDEQQFEAFLKGEEAHYKIPLEWSYRRKLKAVFKLHYLPAAQAFEAKDYLKARNEWILSLIFPIYQNDAGKHRGVVLTMLRAYINDTLSKIGMMNALLTGQDQYGPEEEIRALYDNFYELIQKESWEEANAKSLELENTLKKIEKGTASVTPPPLPNEITSIDADIRDVLLQQVSPITSSTQDWEPLRQDLLAKSKIIQSRMQTDSETPPPLDSRKDSS